MYVCCLSVCAPVTKKSHMDPQYNGAKPPEGNDTAWAPPVKVARLEQCEGGGSSAHESSGQGSPSAKSPVLVLKPSTPQSKNWHKRGKVQLTRKQVGLFHKKKLPAFCDFYLLEVLE